MNLLLLIGWLRRCDAVVVVVVLGVRQALDGVRLVDDDEDDEEDEDYDGDRRYSCVIDVPVWWHPLRDVVASYYGSVGWKQIKIESTDSIAHPFHMFYK